MTKCFLNTYLEPSSVCMASRHDWENVMVAGLSADSRRLQSQGAFFVLDGPSQSGELFIHDVLIKCPAAILVADHAVFERVVEIVNRQCSFTSNEIKPVVLWVKDLRDVFHRGLRRYWGCPDDFLTLIGVTGTNGKSSVAWILAELLARMSHSARGVEILGIQGSYGAFYVGTLGKIVYSSEVVRKSGSCLTSDLTSDLCCSGYQLRKEVLPTCNTTPGPEELWQFFAEMRSRGLRYGVLEVSSHALHQGRTTGVNWDGAIFTNFTRDHLDYHPSEEDYLKAKERLFSEELLASTKPRKIAVFNRSDMAVRTVGERFKASLTGQNAERVVCCYFTDLSEEHIAEPLSSHKCAIPSQMPENIIRSFTNSSLPVGEDSNDRDSNDRDGIGSLEFKGAKDVCDPVELDVRRCCCREDGIYMELMLRRSAVGLSSGEFYGGAQCIEATSSLVNLPLPLTVQSQLVGRYNATNLLTALTYVLNLWELEWSLQESSADMLPVEVSPAKVSSSGTVVSPSTRDVLELLKDTLLQLSRVPGRFELLTVGGGMKRRYVVVDYAHTPDALDRVQRSIREVFSQRLVTVFGSGGDRDRGKRPLMGEAVSRHSDMAIVTNDNPRSERPDDIATDIIAGFPSGFPWRKVLDRGAAIDLAIRMTGPGDVVLIAGKGHEDYQEQLGERIAFSDSRYVSQMSID